MDRAGGVLIVDTDNFSRVVDIGGNGIFGTRVVDGRVLFALAQKGVGVSIRVGIPAYNFPAFVDSLSQGIRGARVDELLESIPLEHIRLFRSFINGKVGTVETDNVATTVQTGCHAVGRTGKVDEAEAETEAGLS